ncbi:hypothetical protein B0I35DRAFT_139997 [Stachybotrys elegans]|uniref:DUF1765-domain-containing protein n=1 Tax=Stachybotrys elegans TaxID=80388 RepID=A0A8K0WVF2_9HYPO|nr:hypothetical protein B0I35DRAFT_139997 [Stachybotrys elegans]
MTGSVLTMASAVDTTTTSSYGRSHSASDLQSTAPSPGPDRHSSIQSGFDLPSFNDDFDLDISGLSSPRHLESPEKPAALVTTDVKTESPAKSQSPARPSRLSLVRPRKGSFIDRPVRSWLPGSGSRLQAAEAEVEAIPQRPTTSYGEDGREEPVLLLKADSKNVPRSTTVTDSLVHFAKRSWIPSRSPSPRGRSASVTGESSAPDAARTLTRRLSKSRKKPEPTTEQTPAKPTPEPTKATPRAFTRASNYLAKFRQSSASSLTKLQENSTESDQSCASSATSLAPPATNSIETATSQSVSLESNTATTDDSSGDMPNQGRDVLWSSFKTLEIEYRNFLAKPMPQRVQHIQQALLPFLRNTMIHESVKVLSPEDVDRRAVILNRWWNAVLDLFEDQAMSYSAEADRPVLLEAAMSLMMRPEWRQTTPLFLPLAQRSSQTLHARPASSHSSSSVGSGEADFLAESAEHNVRTMFVSGLMRQLAFAVDKLSLRHVPFSLVSFAAKSFAYAFFFAPGVADVLVRLWGLTPALIRRASDELGLPRKNTPQGENVAALFPPAVSSFKWTSPRAMWETIKIVPPMSMQVAQVPWMGPWISRWKGRDTDLFFNFYKDYHVLFEEFVPPNQSLKEKAAYPGFVLVQAQLLSTLDMTIHRQNPLDGVMGPSMLDAMHGADASALLPPPSIAPWKGKAENKLVVLLRDVLYDNSSDIARAKHTFAQAFMSMASAATRKIPQFNNTASYALCDFLEEALPIVTDFEDYSGSKGYIDWKFWVDVWSRILNSFHTMSEIRMFAFIYTIWDTLAADPSRKKAICANWLLSETTFETYFNHWCPMVRAYYHRLLCWRICRDDGGASEVDAQIFSLATTRLRLVWAHYLWLKEAAEMSGRAAPSSSPTLPTPNKKFVIIRQELNIPQPGLLADTTTYVRPSSSDKGTDHCDGSATPKGDKKRWSLLGKVFSLATNSSAEEDAPAPGVQRRPSWEDDFLNVRRETAEARSRQGPPPPPKLTKVTAPTADAFAASPVFEEPQFIFKFILAWQQTTAPSRNRVLVRPVLPGPAQTRLRLKNRSGTATPPSPSLKPNTEASSGSIDDDFVDTTRDATPLASAHGASQPSNDYFGEVMQGFEDSTLLFSKEKTSSESDSLGAPWTGIKLDSASPDRGSEATQPEKPVGMYSRNAVYTGRALAEWSGVVFEYNNFIERRRDEGVISLEEMEVPQLSAEGFRKLAG